MYKRWSGEERRQRLHGTCNPLTKGGGIFIHFSDIFICLYIYFFSFSLQLHCILFWFYFILPSAHTCRDKPGRRMEKKYRNKMAVARGMWQFRKRASGTLSNYARNTHSHKKGTQTHALPKAGGRSNSGQLSAERPTPTQLSHNNENWHTNSVSAQLDSVCRSRLVWGGGGERGKGRG